MSTRRRYPPEELQRLRTNPPIWKEVRTPEQELVAKWDKPTHWLGKALIAIVAVVLLGFLLWCWREVIGSYLPRVE